MKNSGGGAARRVENKRSELLNIVKERMLQKLLEKTYDGRLLEELSAEVAERRNNPYSATETILKKINMN